MQQNGGHARLTELEILKKFRYDPNDDNFTERFHRNLQIAKAR
jgi:hypothetical protein